MTFVWKDSKYIGHLQQLIPWRIGCLLWFLLRLIVEERAVPTISFP